MYPDKQHVHDSVNISQVSVQIHKFLVLKTHKNNLIFIEIKIQVLAYSVCPRKFVGVNQYQR